jgi:hypothetical protein
MLIADAPMNISHMSINPHAAVLLGKRLHANPAYMCSTHRTCYVIASAIFLHIGFAVRTTFNIIFLLPPLESFETFRYVIQVLCTSQALVKFHMASRADSY